MQDYLEQERKKKDVISLSYYNLKFVNVLGSEPDWGLIA